MLLIIAKICSPPLKYTTSSIQLYPQKLKLPANSASSLPLLLYLYILYGKRRKASGDEEYPGERHSVLAREYTYPYTHRSDVAPREYVYYCPRAREKKKVPLKEIASKRVARILRAKNREKIEKSPSGAPFSAVERARYMADLRLSLKCPGLLARVVAVQEKLVGTRWYTHVTGSLLRVILRVFEGNMRQFCVLSATEASNEKIYIEHF